MIWNEHRSKNVKILIVLCPNYIIFDKLPFLSISALNSCHDDIGVVREDVDVIGINLLDCFHKVLTARVHGLTAADDMIDS